MIVTSNIVSDLNTAFSLINQGTNEKIKQSEAILNQIRGNIQYPKVLFDYISTYDISLGLRAAIELKLWFKEYKNFDDFQAQPVNEVVQSVKQNIIQLYMLSNPPLTHQLKETISYIASRDYPILWPQLITELNQCLQHPDFVLKALKLTYKLTQKYVYLSRSDPLYEEIILTCDTLHNSLLILATSIIQQINAGQNLRLSYEILKSLIKVFYNLNFQDLHPLFEDNLQNWMEFLRLVLGLPPIQGLEDNLFKCKGEALKSVLLYAQKYREDFASLIQVFCQEIWNVCTQTNNQRSSDKIVLCALRYFKSLITWADLKAFFEQKVKELIETLIVKNLQITSKKKLQKIQLDDELLLFEEEPSEFMEKFFEQGDLDSRRSQAIELFKTLTKHYQTQVNQIIYSYKEDFIKNIGNNNNQQIEMTLINLIIEGSTAAFTSKEGVVELYLSPEILNGFFSDYLGHKFSEMIQLQKNNQSVENKWSPIQLAFYCRFLFYFRNIIPKNNLILLAQMVSKLQISKNLTLQKIACYTTNALINIKIDPKNFQDPQLYFKPQDISTELQIMLTDVYTNIRQQKQLDPYSLKLTNSLINLLKNDIINALPSICDLLEDLLNKISQEYEFSNTHLVFEIISSVADVCVQSQNTQAANQLQQKILTPLDSLMRDNKGDVVNFVLQIYSLLFQVQSNATQYYTNLLGNFLEVNNWSEANNSLFSAYIVFLQYTLPTVEVPTDKLQLILKTIVSHSPQSYTELSKLLIRLNQQWIGVVLSILIEQYQYQQNNQPLVSSKSKSTQFNQRLLNKEVYLLMSNINQLYGPQILVNEFNRIQPQLIDFFLINELTLIRSISQRQERKQIYSMLTTLLFSGNYVQDQTRNYVFQAMVENILQKRKNPIKFLGRLTDREVTSGSGFQVLKPIQLQNVEKNIMDEDKFFCSTFHQFFEQMKSTFPIQQLLNEQQQLQLSQLLTSR